MLRKLRRVGVLVPSSDSVTESDFKRFLPDNVTFHTARLPHSDSTKRGHATLDEICSGIEAASATLVQISPEVVVFACTSGSFHRGEGWDIEVKRRVETSSGSPGIVTAIAVVDALRRLSSKKIFMITPYPEDINRLEVEYFSRHGLEISDYTYFHCEKSNHVSEILPERIVERIRESSDKVAKCDTIFISCTGLRGMETVELVEQESGKPTVTSNSANIFAALRQLGVDTPQVRGGGRLYSTEAAA